MIPATPATDPTFNAEPALEGEADPADPEEAEGDPEPEAEGEPDSEADAPEPEAEAEAEAPLRQLLLVESWMVTGSE
jgi:hypothetical protein